MRYFTTTVALVVLFVFGFAAKPASANCHTKLEAAQAKLDKVPGGYDKRAEIEKLISKAEKFKDNKKKKKKCGKILKKVNKMLKKAGKGNRAASDKCAALIKEAESNLFLVPAQAPPRSLFVSNIVQAKKYKAKGSHKKCVKIMEKTIQEMADL